MWYTWMASQVSGPGLVELPGKDSIMPLNAIELESLGDDESCVDPQELELG